MAINAAYSWPSQPQSDKRIKNIASKMVTIQELDQSIRFSEAAMLNKQHDPWLQRKRPGESYAVCEIVSCDNDSWWYKDFIGLEFMAQLVFGRYIGGNYLKEVLAVRIAGTKIHIGRSLDPKDIIIK